MPFYGRGSKKASQTNSTEEPDTDSKKLRQD